MENLLSESCIRQLKDGGVRVVLDALSAGNLQDRGVRKTAVVDCVSSVDSGRVWERSDNISDVFFVGVSVTNMLIILSVGGGRGQKRH